MNERFWAADSDCATASPSPFESEPVDCDPLDPFYFKVWGEVGVSVRSDREINAQPGGYRTRNISTIIELSFLSRAHGFLNGKWTIPPIL